MLFVDDRFRIAAVYSNNDNKLGPNSGKFILEKEPPKRKPAFSPKIDVAEPVSQSAIMIQWKVNDSLYTYQMIFFLPVSLFALLFNTFNFLVL